jgi:pyruvate/2-oxoglutarate dehydrogenase complex dihydrolipoamide dehydrogenase (E3) component
VKYEYDILCIGLGPAGMAVSIMGAEMGLKVCAVEMHKIGGECMNVGCIPSKSLLRMAKTRSTFDKLDRMGLARLPKPEVIDPFPRIDKHLEFIREQKTMKMFDKVHLIYQEGPASFRDPHTVEVGGKGYGARRIFICAGTRPSVPSFPGLDEVGYLTNENMFALDNIPERMIIVGGGAIACEMAQAFSRLGSKVTFVIRGPRLMWRESRNATDILEATFEKEGITILREQSPAGFEKASEGNGEVTMRTDKGETVSADRVLVAAGRKMAFDKMNLKGAGIAYTDQGIVVDKFLRTSRPNIYACGDCNGHAQFSHAAMHQGMIALMNSMMPRPFKKDFRRFPVPWTVFTDPQFSRVGSSEQELEEKGIKHEVIKVNYNDYGAAIAESVDVGHVEVRATAMGRILGVDIIGEGSGEMINEWALAMQNNLRLHKIMMTQHSFPTMGFLSKRASETWMMNRMKSDFVKRLCRLMFRR